MRKIIISTVRVNTNSDIMYSYQEFEEMAFGDKGLNYSEGDVFYVNVNDVAEEHFLELKTMPDMFQFFTTDGTGPDFIDVEVSQFEELKDAPQERKSIQIKSNEGNTGSSQMDSILEMATSEFDEEIPQEEESSKKENAKVILFGSSKGGTGKTFTSVMSTYRLAKQNPNKRIALIDFDIIDGQVGISIHKIKPTMARYHTEYQKGYSDFQTMKRFAVNANAPYPSNVDFYLAPNDGTVIDDDAFWISIIVNCIENYDYVVFDTGIDYLNIVPISYAYKLADKIILITTTSIKSVNSVTKQIAKLTGNSANNVFSKDDEIQSKLNIVITQMVESSDMNGTIYNSLNQAANVVATFGVITESVSKAEFYGQWDVFDNNPRMNETFDNIMKV